MTPDMTWDNKDMDHVKPNNLFVVSKGEELKEAFNRKNTKTVT